MRAVPRAGIRAFQEGKVEFFERRKAGKRTNIKPKTISPSRYNNENLLIGFMNTTRAPIPNSKALKGAK
jgi:hypothetical protein